MAEDEKKPALKSRREALYTNKSSVAAREDRAKPAAMAKEAPAKPAVSREHAEMFRRHENERRDMHGRQRSEHRAMDADPAPDLAHKKVAVHHRHAREMSEMHEKHEKELIDKLAAMHKDEGGGEKEAA